MSQQKVKIKVSVFPVVEVVTFKKKYCECAAERGGEVKMLYYF